MRHRVHLVELAGVANPPAIANREGVIIAPVVDAIAEYIQSRHLKTPVIIGHSLGGEMALMLGTRYPHQVGRLLIVDALPFYTLMFDPAATSETAARHATSMRDWLLSQSPEQIVESQNNAIARLAKTEAVRPALVDAAIHSDSKTFAEAVYELMISLIPIYAVQSVQSLRQCAFSAPYSELTDQCLECLCRQKNLPPINTEESLWQA